MKIGHVIVTRAFDLDRAHESPNQYYTIRVEPGEYPIEVHQSRFAGAHGGSYVVVVWNGNVLHSGYGGKRYREEEGKPGVVTTQPYKYQLRSGRYHGRVTITDDAKLETVRGV